MHSVRVDVIFTFTLGNYISLPFCFQFGFSLLSSARIILLCTEKRGEILNSLYAVRKGLVKNEDIQDSKILHDSVEIYARNR